MSFPNYKDVDGEVVACWNVWEKISDKHKQNDEYTIAKDFENNIFVVVKGGDVTEDEATKRMNRVRERMLDGEDD